MIIKSMNVKNFRSILDETLHFDNLTALVGANGSGKSSFLHSLELFQAKQPKIISDDFYNKNTDNEIIISITFSNLSDSAKEQFSKYVQNDELTVERVFKFPDGKLTSTYHGSTLQNPDFAEFRKHVPATPAKEEYEKLKQKDTYRDFPNWSSHEKARNTLSEWEESNSDKCTRLRDDGQFFGYSDVASGHLGKFIKLLYIPAVRDASLDATEGKNSTLSDLMEIVVKSEIMKKEEVQKFQNEFKEKYEKILNKDNMKEISTLSDSLTKTLNNYVPDAKIDLSWLTLKDFQITLPTAIANLVEDGYSATVDRTGHGLQRVFIMTLLQYLSTINENSGQSATTDLPTLVLIIEEPELYQHPNRQRHISEICIALSECKVDGVSSTTQVVYSTHSPHFVGLDRINQIRLLRKQVNDDKPKITKISNTTVKNLATELAKHHGGKFTEYNLIPRLHMIRTPWINEGFFSKCVVLVEGDSDRATLLGASKTMNINLESQGISIIPCFGKGNLDKVAIIFKQLGIPTYVIWDNDREDGKEKELEVKNNKTLLKLFEQEESDYPSHVKNDHACIDGTLETMLEHEIGTELYETMMDINRAEYDLNRADALKNPTVLKTMLEDLEKSGGEIPPTIKQILENIQQLSQQ